MGVTFIVWKWADKERAAEVREVVDVLLADAGHPALDRFDLKTFVKEMRSAVRDQREVSFTIDVSDFSGFSCNWAIINCGYEAGARLLPALLEVAGRFGAVVYGDERGRLVGKDEAVEGLAELSKQDGFKQSIEARHESFVREYLAPAARALGFKQLKYCFSRVDGDRVCSIFQPFHGFNSTAEIRVSMGFRSLAAFLNGYRIFCKEKPMNERAASHVQINLQECRPEGGRIFWRLDVAENLPSVGRAAADMLVEVIPMFQARYGQLTDVLEKWSREDEHDTIELASALWVLGQQDRAMILAKNRIEFLSNELKRRHFPPFRSERIDLEFFVQFLRSLG